MSNKITYFIKGKKYFKGEKEIPRDTINKELKKYQIEKLEREKQVNVIIKQAKLSEQKEEKQKRYRNKEEYKLLIDNPKALIGAEIIVNEGVHGKVERIIGKEPPFTIYEFKYDNLVKDKE